MKSPILPKLTADPGQPANFSKTANFSQSANFSQPANFSKLVLMALLFLTGYTQGFSQKKTKIALSSLPAVTIRLTDPDSLPAARPENLFRHFEVLDERPDTARIGIHSGFRAFGAGNKQLTFTRSAKEEVSAWLNDHFTRPGAPYTALVVLRTLWLSDANYIRDDLVKDPDRRFEKTRIWIKAEIYAATDSGYMPVFRFDSAHVSKKNSYSRWGSDVAGMLDDFADSASFLTARKAGKGRSLHMEDILQFNQARFSVPIIADSSLVQGVYASFEEFKTNAPSIRDFEIKKEKDKSLLYVREPGGNTYYSHNAWGYCDGKDIFIMKDGLLRPVWREGKAYYFFSEAADKERALGPGYTSVPPASTGTILNPGAMTATDMFIGGAIAPLIRSSPNTNIRIFTVDMDSGEVF